MTACGSSQADVCINTSRPRQNCRQFTDDIFKCIFLNENIWISFEISLKFFPEVRTNNIPALVQIMAWRLPGDKPLSEPMMVSSLTHIYAIRPQRVKAVQSIPTVEFLKLFYMALQLRYILELVHLKTFESLTLPEHLTHLLTLNILMNCVKF